MVRNALQCSRPAAVPAVSSAPRPFARRWLAIAALVLAVPMASAAVLAATSTTARAEDAPAATAERPARGMKMSEVESRYGAPATRHEAIGNPPITRWDYPGFIVFFEHDHVVHAVTLKSA